MIVPALYPIPRYTEARYKGVWLYLIMLDKEYNACFSVFCNFVHSPVISSLLAPNIFLSNLFSNTLNLCSTLKVMDQVLQPYNATVKVLHHEQCLWDGVGKTADRFQS